MIYQVFFLFVAATAVVLETTFKLKEKEWDRRKKNYIWNKKQWHLGKNKGIRGNYLMKQGMETELCDRIKKKRFLSEK